MLGSAAVLTLSMMICRRRNMDRRWMILPMLTWLYELFPYTLPGPIDEYLAFGGAATVLVWQFLQAEVLGSGTPAEPPQPPPRPVTEDEGPIIDVTSTVMEDRVVQPEIGDKKG